MITVAVTKRIRYYVNLKYSLPLTISQMAI